MLNRQYFADHDNESMLAILSDTFSKGYAAALSDMEKTIKKDPG